MPFWYGGMWMPLLMPIVVGAVVYFLYKNGVFKGMCGSMQNNDNRMNRSKETSTPLEILKRRYAKGEISTEEYRKMKEELKED